MKRSLILISGIAATVVLSKLLLEDVFGVDLGVQAGEWVAHAGAGSAVAVVALLAIDLFLPVPSSVVMVLSGAAFGPLWGSVLSLVGSVGGEWLGFEIVRRFGRRAATRIVDADELQHLERIFEKYGAPAVIVSRALPIVMETMSVVAGLSKMKRATFLLASFAGTTPIVVVYAYAGSVSRQTGSLVPAIVMLIAATGGAFIWYRARVSHMPSPPATATPASRDT